MRDLVAPTSTAPAPKWFVTVGRYTNEKNHERLITAFASVHRRHPEARLLIVGHGPLQESLARLIVRLGLVTVAHITGALSNPFSVMSRADCFVLSSDYEGQPMVLLEASVLDMPIVSTRFATVEDALPEDTIHIVEQDAEALAEGMIAFLDGRVERSHLDSTAYNERAVASFLEALRLPVAARSTPAPALAPATATATATAPTVRAL
ncbi:glycosyltransferase [Frondihabitans sp. PAMC 28766]|uniref:glycosyltransferase n=1 Tax=Frondihabitans sp. PAMC 28766 TaxID=1795630 RepID=UPI001EF65224|nr:glycosyltransferase [Frondihabitans sp. PAMC 28766]